MSVSGVPGVFVGDRWSETTSLRFPFAPAPPRLLASKWPQIFRGLMIQVSSEGDC